MRKTLLMSAAALGLAIAAPAFAQTTPPGATGTPGATATTPGPTTPAAPSTGTAGASTTTAPMTHRPMHRYHARTSAPATSEESSNMVRPGHVPGVGPSEPASTQASNIDSSDVRSRIAPRLPTPRGAENATPEQLLGIAQNALRRGATGEAQQALEMAETRALDRVTSPSAANAPERSPLVNQIDQALHSLASHDRAGAQQAIAEAMNAPSTAQGSAGMSQGGAGTYGNTSRYGAPAAGGTYGSSGMEATPGGAVGTGMGSMGASGYGSSQRGPYASPMSPTNPQVPGQTPGNNAGGPASTGTGGHSGASSTSP